MPTAGIGVRQTTVGIEEDDRFRKPVHHGAGVR
jgi:hypothetical protein